ncbi:MAG: M50 family metallopeptidase [Ignavibacteria bacterium]|nr:M50 family metallopeptidase [Ignavibacteria bacterium]
MRNKYLLTISLSLIAINIFFMQIPPLTVFLYPFMILSTWFHEMGHGICSLILGGNFYYLEIFPNGSGIAHLGTPTSLGNIGNALIALSGPLFPPIVGYFFIVSTKRNNRARLLLFFTSICIFVSTIVWVRSAFGFIFLIVFSILIFWIALTKMEKLHFITSQIIGIQAFMSVYLSMGYLFSSTGNVNQSSLLSDTEIIAQNLLLPNWFWAIFIILFTVLLLFLALKSLKTKVTQPLQ